MGDAAPAEPPGEQVAQPEARALHQDEAGQHAGVVAAPDAERPETVPGIGGQQGQQPGKAMGRRGGPAGPADEQMARPEIAEGGAAAHHAETEQGTGQQAAGKGRGLGQYRSHPGMWKIPFQ